MTVADTAGLELLWQDFDAREQRLRAIVAERLAASPPPIDDDHVVASYFFALRTLTLGQLAGEIAYHATSGVRHPPPGSLLAACTARVAGIDPFDATERLGLLHMAF